MPGFTPCVTISSATTCRMVFNSRNWSIATLFAICSAPRHLSLSTCVRLPVQYSSSLACLSPFMSLVSQPSLLAETRVLQWRQLVKPSAFRLRLLSNTFLRILDGVSMSISTSSSVSPSFMLSWYDGQYPLAGLTAVYDGFHVRLTSSEALACSGCLCNGNARILPKTCVSGSLKLLGFCSAFLLFLALCRCRITSIFAWARNRKTD